MKRKIIFISLGASLIFSGILFLLTWRNLPSDGCLWEDTPEGVLISNLKFNGTSYLSGLKKGDIILEIEGIPVKDSVSAFSVLQSYKPGESVKYLVKQGEKKKLVFIRLKRVSLSGLKIWFLLNGIALFWFSIGLFVYFKKPDDKSAQIFYLTSLSWFGNMILSGNWAINWISISKLLPLYLYPAFFFHFTLIFPSPKRIVKRYSWVEYLVYLPGFIQIIVNLYFFLNFGNPRLDPFGQFPLLNTFRWIYIDSFLLCSVISLLHSYIKADSTIKRNQIKWIFWGLGVSYIFSFIFGTLFSIFGFKPLIGDLESSIIMGVCIPLSFFYAILKYRVMEIDFVINKSIIYTLLTGGIVAIYLFVVNIFGRITYIIWERESFLITIFPFFLIAILFNPLRKTFQNLVDRTFYRNEYYYRQELEEFAKELTGTVELKELAKMIVNRISEMIGIEKVYLFIFNKRTKSFILEEGKGNLEDSQITISETLIEILAKNSKPIMIEQLNEILQREDLKRIYKMEIELCLPIIFRGKLVSILFLGRKLSGKLYSSLDINFLSFFSSQVAIALNNSITYRELEEANQEILETQKKLFEAEKLATIGELASGIAHQIRNPLGVIKSSADILKKEFSGDETNFKLAEFIKTETDRLNKLVNELLNFSKKIDLEMELSDLNKILEDVISLVEKKGEGRISIIKRFSKLPLIPIDRNQIYQAFLNICINAIEAMPEGGELFLSTREEKNLIVISFKDTGKGISKENIDKIFKPFFTEKKDGVGLGLSIVEKIVKAHNGRIEVKSEIGKGSNFTIYLPKKEVGV